MKEMKEKLTMKYHIAIGGGFLFLANSALASKVATGINTGTSWLKAAGFLVLALIALSGCFMLFQGILAMANTGQSQVTKGQAFGKALAGLAMILVPALIMLVSGDLGIDGVQAPADIFGAP